MYVESYSKTQEYRGFWYPQMPPSSSQRLSWPRIKVFEPKGGATRLFRIRIRLHYYGLGFGFRVCLVLSCFLFAFLPPTELGFSLGFGVEGFWAWAEG